MKKFLLGLFASVAVLGAFALAEAPNISTTAVISTGAKSFVGKLSPGQSNLSIQVTGTFTSTLSFKISNDGVNFYPSPNDAVQSATAPGLYFVTGASALYYEITTASITGTANVNVSGTSAGAPPLSSAAAPQPSPLYTSPVSCATPSCNVTVYQATAASLNANVSQATAANLNVTSQSNLANFAGSATTTALGLPSQQLFPANTSGGGCGGVNLTSGTQITKTNLFIIISSGEAAFQVVAPVASKMIHVCALSFSGVVTASSNVNLDYGTGTNCGTGLTALFQGTISSQTFAQGDGQYGLFDTPAGTDLCVSTGAFTGTGTVMNLTYAQY